MTLVPDWKQAYKWFSVWAAGALGVLLSIQAALPMFDTPLLADLVHSTAWHTGTAVLAFVIIVLRLVHQPTNPPKE